jgi:hypothetical protein
MNQYIGLYNEIREKSIKRLDFENMRNHEKLTDRNSKWFNQPEEFAINTFSYYM